MTTLPPPLTLEGFAAVLLATGALLAGLAAQKRARRVQSIARGLLVSLFTLVLMSGALESYFRFFYADSGYPFMVTYASKNWVRFYIQRNSWGFRDREWNASALQGKTQIVVTGDSFTEGWGLNNPADRFGDVLAGRLGSAYAVVNLGRLNTDTRTQLQIFRGTIELHPELRPDLVVWQYFLNDIEYHAIQAQGSSAATFPPRPPLADQSYLADFIYWQVARPRATGVSLWDFLYAGYDNSVVWANHRRDIDAMIDYVDSLDARLVVVIFPNLQDPVTSIAYVDRVAQAIQARGHDDILTLYDAVAAWNPRDVVVSPLDAHASAAFNHYVGELLYERFFATP